MLLSTLFYLLLLASGFPIGIIIAYLCSDEIKKWRKNFKIIVIISLILSILIYFTSFEFKLPIIFSLSFFMIFCLTIIWKTL